MQDTIKKATKPSCYSVQQFASSSRLPTLPEVASKLIELAQQEDPDFQEVARVIRTDPVVSGKVMTTVNSALFCFRPKVETVEDAVNKLGLSMIRTLLLSFNLAQHSCDDVEMQPILQQHWRSSLTQAAFAELIAQQLDLDPSAFFLASMLQDIGILAILSEQPRLYVDNILDRTQFPIVAAAEGSILGFSHVDVSATIIREWGLSERFEQAALHHHDEVATPLGKDDDPLVAVTRAASLGTAVLMSGSNRNSLDNKLDQWTDCLKSQLGITAEQADEMMSEVHSLVNQYAALFCFDIGEGVRVEHVISKAKDMLQEIALANQMELVSSKKNSNKKNEDLYLDDLSGLNNRRFMNENLGEIMSTAISKRRPIALLFMDLDRFKSINDNLGHSAGDKAIVHVAQWLKKSIRKDDTAIRLGGDEFLVILESITSDQLHVIAQRVTTEIPRLQIDDETLEIRLSVGGAFYQPLKGDRSNPNWLIDHADRSMYAAKRSGGGCVEIEEYNGQ